MKILFLGDIVGDSGCIAVKKHLKTMCVSVVSHLAEAQVFILTAQMKKGSQKRQNYTIFFDFPNQANTQVPIFIDQKKVFQHLPGSPGSGGSPGNGKPSAAPNPPTMPRGSG